MINENENIQPELNMVSEESTAPVAEPQSEPVAEPQSESQTDFDSGNVTIAKGDDWRLDATPMGWSVWIGMLWVVLSMPLWLGLWNSLTDFGDYNEIYQGGVEIIEEVQDIEVPETVATIA